MLQISFRTRLYLMVGILYISVILLMGCFYINSAGFFVLGYSLLTIGYSFASNTILIYVKGFSENCVKAVGIATCFTHLIGNIYCIVLDRFFKIWDYYLYFLPFLLFLIVLIPLYLILFKFFGKSKSVKWSIFNKSRSSSL